MGGDIMSSILNELIACPDLNSEAIDFRVASELFAKRSRTLDNKSLQTLGILTEHVRTAVLEPRPGRTQ